MRLILAAGMAFWLTGCVLNKTPKTVAAAPLAPKPTPAPPAPPPPPPEPLSMHQTNVELPAAQPISQEALNTLQLPEEAAPSAPLKHPGRGGSRNTPSSTGSAKPEPPRTEAPKPEAAKPEAAPPTAAPPPQIREIVSPEVQQQYKQRADEVRRETLQRINNVRGHKAELDQIHGFLKLSAETEKHGDMRSAYDLADKALVLAKELTGGK